VLPNQWCKIMSKKIRSRQRPIAKDAAPTEQPTTPNEASPEPATPEVNDEIISSAESDSEPLTAAQAKLLQMRVLQLQGKRQKEMAKHFGISDRAIRYWDKRARSLRIGLDIDVQAKAMISAMLVRFTALEAELIEWKRDAEATGNDRTKLACAKELRQLNLDRIRQLNTLGLFDGFRFTLEGEQNGSDAGADLLMSLLGDVLAPQDPDEGGENDH
jgi:hypothetical protein